MKDRAKQEVMQMVPDSIWAQIGVDQPLGDGIPADEVLAVRSVVGVPAKRLPEGMRAGRGLFLPDEESPMFWVRDGLVKSAPEDCIAIVRPYDLPDGLRLPKIYIEKALALEDQAQAMLERAVTYDEYSFPDLVSAVPSAGVYPTIPDALEIPEVSTSDALAADAESGLRAAPPAAPALGTFAGEIPSLITPAIGEREEVSIPDDVTIEAFPSENLPELPEFPDLDYEAISITGTFLSGEIEDKTLSYTALDSTAGGVAGPGVIVGPGPSGAMPTLTMPSLTLEPLEGEGVDPSFADIPALEIPEYEITSYSIPPPEAMADFVTELESRMEALGFYKNATDISGFELALKRYRDAFADEDPELAMLALTEIQRTLEGMQTHAAALGQKTEALLGESRLRIEQVSTQLRLEIEAYSVRAQSLIAEYQAKVSGVLGVAGTEAEAAAMNWRILSEIRGLELQHLGLQVQANLDAFVAQGRQAIEVFAANVARFQAEKGLALEQERYVLEPALASLSTAVQQEQQKLEQRVAEAQTVISHLGTRLQERMATNASKIEAYMAESQNVLQKFAQDLGAWSTNAQLALQNQAVKIEAQMLSLQSKGFIAEKDLQEIQRAHADYQLQLNKYQVQLSSFLELYSQQGAGFQIEVLRMDKTREGILLVEQLRRELDQIKLGQAGFDLQRVAGDYAMIVQNFQSKVEKWANEVKVEMDRWQMDKGLLAQQEMAKMEAHVSNVQAKLSHYMAYIQGAQDRSMVLLQLAMQYRSQAVLLIQNWIHDFGSRIGLVGLTGLAIAPQRMEAIRQGGVG